MFIGPTPSARPTIPQAKQFICFYCKQPLREFPKNGCKSCGGNSFVELEAKETEIDIFRSSSGGPR